MGLQLGEGHLDRVQVGRVFRQVEEPGASFSEGVFGTLAVVDAEIVEDYDVARRECRGELGLDVDFERRPVHGAFDDPGRRELPAAQARNERLCTPLSERRRCLQALSAERPAAQAAHVGLHRGFIDEHQTAGLSLHGGLAVMLPVRPGGFHISAFLLRRQQRFFYM